MRGFSGRKGVVLILCYMVIVSLTIAGLGLFGFGVAELKAASIYRDSARAFWLAEAGLQQAYYELQQDIDWGPEVTVPVSADGCAYVLVQDLGNRLNIVSVGSYTGGQHTFSRSVSADIAKIPYLADNTISSGGDIDIDGLSFWFGLDVNGKTRLTGTVDSSGYLGFKGLDFDDKQEGVGSDYTTYKIPDMDGDTLPDEYADFKLYAQDACSAAGDNGVYISTDAEWVTITPNPSYVGKEIVYVEGTSEDTGNVLMVLGTTWQSGQDLTVVSSGEILYAEPIQYQENARLNTISWKDYSEGAFLASIHEGVHFTHGQTNYADLVATSGTKGNLISNGDVNFDVWIYADKTFDFSDRFSSGDIPPAFSGLITAGRLGTELHDWREE